MYRAVISSTQEEPIYREVDKEREIHIDSAVDFNTKEELFNFIDCLKIGTRSKKEFNNVVDEAKRSLERGCRGYIKDCGDVSQHCIGYWIVEEK